MAREARWLRLAGISMWLFGCGTLEGDTQQGPGPAGSSHAASTDDAPTNTTTVSPSSSAPDNVTPTSETSPSESGQGPTPTTSDPSPAPSATSSPSAPINPEPSPPPSPTGSSPVFQPDGSNIPPRTGPLGVETTCDGQDDDSNGVIDDVDATADGVCDCLRVATLGLHGEWGDGNVVSGWMNAHLETPVSALDGETLTSERLAPYQVILVRDVSSNNNPSLSFSAGEVEALWNWVRDGGGLMTVIGYSDATEINNVNRLLEPFALSYGSDQIVQGQGAAVPVTEWFEHSLTRGITRIGADNGYPALGQGITIAAQDEFDMGKAVTIGDGHVLVWGDEWVTYETEWSADATYQVEQFWKNALAWLTRLNECQVPQD